MIQGVEGVAWNIHRLMKRIFRPARICYSQRQRLVKEVWAPTISLTRESVQKKSQGIVGREKARYVLPKKSRFRICSVTKELGRIVQENRARQGSTRSGKDRKIRVNESDSETEDQ